VLGRVGQRLARGHDRVRVPLARHGPGDARAAAGCRWALRAAPRQPCESSVAGRVFDSDGLPSGTAQHRRALPDTRAHEWLNSSAAFLAHVRPSLPALQAVAPFAETLVLGDPSAHAKELS
jgi:hypothetical protein